MGLASSIIHQLNDMSELAGASIATVKEGIQTESSTSCESILLQLFFDLTKTTLLSVFVVGVR